MRLMKTRRMFRRAGTAPRYRSGAALLLLSVLVELSFQQFSWSQEGAKMVTNNVTGIQEPLTQQDGKAIKEALMEAILRSEDLSLHKLAAEVKSAAPFIDSSGTLYLKTWRLDRQKGRLVKRPLGVSE